MLFLSNILLFLLVLGVLIFFHELGHFLAAKACGVYVDRFSLGMPPRVWGLKIGETDYCIGALPIGGFVKMAGQEDAPLDDEEREKTYGHVPEDRWFNKKPIWQRYIVIAAGPLMNVVLAVLLYGIAAAHGGLVPEGLLDSRIGYVEPKSPAAQAPLYELTSAADTVADRTTPSAIGWHPGDRILSINGNKVSSFEDIQIDAVLAGGAELQVVVERSAPDGATKRYLSTITPEVLSGEKHPRFGVTPFSTVLVEEVMPDLPAQQQGLQKGDIITRLNGDVVDRISFVESVRKLTNGQPVHLTVEREPKTFTVDMQPTVVGQLAGITFTSSYYKNPSDKNQPLEIAALSQEVRDATKLQSGDIITEIDGQPATAASLHELEKTYAGKTVTAKVLSHTKLMGLAGHSGTRSVELRFEPIGIVGIVLGEKRVYYSVPANEVVGVAFRECRKGLERTIQTIVLLVSGSVSPKELGGPVMIYQVTTGAAEEGLVWLLRIMALISINLAVFNVLPLPVLDGGLLCFLTLEGIRRKPLDIKVLERIQQVGIAFLLLLMLFVTFNDISRWVTNVLR